jgi:hypothetical protein
MAATVFGSARYGITDDTSATGLHLSDITYTYVSETASAPNHIGTEVATAVYNDGTDVSCNGVVESKTTGFVLDLADTLTLANTTADSLDVEQQNLFTADVGSAGLIVTGGSLTRGNTAFETGNIDARYRPQVSVTSPTVITD